MSNNWPFPRDDSKRERDAVITRIMSFRNDLKYSQLVRASVGTLYEWLELVRNGHALPFEGK